MSLMKSDGTQTLYATFKTAVMNKTKFYSLQCFMPVDSVHTNTKTEINIWCSKSDPFSLMVSQVFTVQL